MFQKNYISELEDERMKLSKVNGKLKEDIQHLKKEKAEIVNQLSIVEVHVRVCCVNGDCDMYMRFQ